MNAVEDSLNTDRYSTLKYVRLTKIQYTFKDERFTKTD